MLEFWFLKDYRFIFELNVSRLQQGESIDCKRVMSFIHEIDK